MILQLPFPELFPSEKISHKDKIFLVGSCFTENIGQKLNDTKFKTFINPHGISFSPLAIARSLESSLQKVVYQQQDLVFHEELWHGLDFHTDFSAPKAEQVLAQMNQATAKAGETLIQSEWLILTAGTAFQYYYLHPNGGKMPVANCHKIPAQLFEKRLLDISEIVGCLKRIVTEIRRENPAMKVIFTVSPVRHIRDGLSENARSKARLIEAFRQLADEINSSWYFPAYEILIDVLRDYRFFDTDLVHPSGIATELIWQQFGRQFFSSETDELIQKIRKLKTACLHKVRFPGTAAHQKFVVNIREQITALTLQYAELDFSEEQERFNLLSD